MSFSSLTPKQQVVYDFVRRYIEAYRRAPSIREIQEGCAIPSYKSAVDRLLALERKRLIHRSFHKHRGIVLLEPNGEPALEGQTV